MQGAEVLTTFTADTKQMDNATKGLQNNLEQTTKKGEIAFLGLTAAVDAFTGAILKGGIEYNAQMQTFNTRLTTLTGSAEGAEKVLSQIKKDALTTPFDVASLTQAESLLLSTGMSADDSREDIIALGDAISASGGGNAELQRMAVNLQQIKNVGKASSLDIKQFAYAGIDIYGLLADSMGITRQEASDLDVTYEMLSKALRKANSEGGKYYGAMEKQSKTYNGAMSNLSESIDVLKGRLAEGLFNAIAKLIPKLTDLFDWLGKNSDTIIAIVVPILAFINAIAGMLIIGKIVSLLSAMWTMLMANPIVLIIGLIAGLVAGFVILWNKCEGFRNFWKSLWAELKPPVMALVSSLKDFWNNVLLPIGTLIWNSWAPRLKYTFEVIKGVVIGVFEGIKVRVQAFLGVIRGVLDFITGVFTGDWKKAWGGIKTAVSSAFNGIVGSVKAVGGNIVKGLWNGMSGLKDWVIDKVKGMGKSILNGLKKVLGIHSPSTEFALVGRFSGEGFVEGLEGMQKQIDKTVNATFNPFSNGSIGSMTASTPTPNVTIHNSMQYDALGQLVNNVKTFSGGAKNDYNYVGGY